MALTYDPAPATGSALRQGEIIGPIWEHRAQYPPRAIPRGQGVSVESIWHSLVVVLSPDCDLEQDYEMRFVSFWAEAEPDVAPTEQHPNAVSQVLVCDLFTREEIRPRFKGEKEIWSRISKNQDERYHHLDGAAVSEVPDSLYLHDLYIDFKKVFALPIERVYDGVLSGDVQRAALLPAYHIHDLIHRFYGFLSRVAIP